MKLMILFLFFPMLLFSQVEVSKSTSDFKDNVFLPVKDNVDNLSGFTSSNSLIYSFVQSVLIVFLLILLVFFLLKWILKKKSLNANNSNNLVFNLLSSFSISSDKRINVMQIASSIYIIAFSDNDVTLIDKITDSKEIELFKNLCVKGNNSNLNDNNYFFDIFKNILNRK